MLSNITKRPVYMEEQYDFLFFKEKGHKEQDMRTRGGLGWWREEIRSRRYAGPRRRRRARVAFVVAVDEAVIVRHRGVGNRAAGQSSDGASHRPTQLVGEGA